MNTNQAKAIQKSISELTLLVEEQHFHQSVLFSEISENAALEYAPLVSAKCVAFAKTHFESIGEAVDYIVEMAESRHQRRLDSIGCLAVIGIKNSSSNTDKVFSESAKIKQLITAE